MMRTGVLALLVSVLGLQQTHAVEACGDKFLLVGRSARFRQAYAAIYPAAIVLFAQPQHGAGKGIRDARLQADLKAAGHRVSVVEDERALTRMLSSEGVDSILTDAADADRISMEAGNAPLKPAVLPVMFEPTKDQAKAIEARYHCRLTASDRSDRYLSAIDDVMKARVSLKKKKS